MSKDKILLITTLAIFLTVSGFVIWDLYGQSLTKNNIQQEASTTVNKPPAEAITACAGKSIGDTCEFLDKNETTKGTCDNKPGILACAPAKVFGNQQNEITQSDVDIKTPDVNKFILASDVGIDNSSLPSEYTCDGSGASPALSWSGAPAETKEYIIMMTTIPVDGNTKWSWVLASIPSTTISLSKKTSGVGKILIPYITPCSQGPGIHTYTFTIYALSAAPSLPNTSEMTGADITKAISSITLSSTSINFNYSRANE